MTADLESRVARLEGEVGARYEHLATKSDTKEAKNAFLWIVVIILLALTGWMTALIVTLANTLSN